MPRSTSHDRNGDPEEARPESRALVPSPRPSGSLPARTQRTEIARIVRRLEAITTNHTEAARRIGHPLTLEQVIAVIDALRAEAEGKSRPVAFSDGEVMFYLMDGLYEELLGEPSNIFLTTRVSEAATRFEPLPRDLWLMCLAALRLRMGRLGFAEA